jgi:uncharacterized membrane protein YdcZ (DUF606 family)
VVIGILAGRFGLSDAMASASISYVMASILLLLAAVVFARRDTQRMQSALTYDTVGAT